VISVITPVWNQQDITSQFLYHHWRLYRGRTGFELVIINNGSTDGTKHILDMYQHNFTKDRMQVITNEVNQGFSVACNQGAKAARGDVLVFLNNDVLLMGDYLTMAENFIGPKGLVGAELLTHDTGWNKFGDVIIPYIPGWCVAVQKASLEALGGFDERYTPADYEDLDLSYNAKQQGYDLVSLPLPLRHLSGMTGGQLGDRRAITEANRIKFAEKWGLSL